MIVKRKKTKVINKPGTRGIESEHEIEKKQPGVYEKKESKFKSSFKKFGRGCENAISDNIRGLFENLEY